MTTLATQLNRGNADLIFLVEFNALKLVDASLTPLYFSNKPFYAVDKQFLPAISSISDLDRSGNDTMDPAYLPTWGDMSLLITGAYKPDAENSVAWNLLLYKDTYTLAGQPLTIKIGTPADAYAAFTTIFTGNIGEISWTDAELNLTVYDKAKELETNYPDYELPESEQVEEDSWDQSVPIILGQVKNYAPVLIKTDPVIEGGVTYTNRYALACHVIDSLVNVYFDQVVAATPAQYLFKKTDVSPPKKDTIGGGTVFIHAYGPYAGTLLQAKWIIQIDSITALNSQGDSGSEVGLATFRWKLDGDVDWRDSGVLTWKLAPDTVTKSPAAGNATMGVSGSYTGDCKLSYKTKVIRGGHIGDAICPQFIWSDDGGVTWNPDDTSWWDPVNSIPSPGEMSVVTHNQGDSVLVEITTGGNVGGAVRFKWSRDGGATWDTGNTIPDTSPIELFTGYSIQFTAPGESGVDDYDAGDSGGSSSAVDILPTIPATLYSMPISLNRGLIVTFTGEGGTGVTTPTWTWTPIGAARGEGSVSIGNKFDVKLVITLGGACGVATFDWIYKDGDPAMEIGSGITNIAAQEIRSGIWVVFTAPGIPGEVDYEIGDLSVISSYYTAPFVVNDLWTFTFKEIPIPLEDSVTIQFFTQAGQDFYLWDEFSFILMSTILVKLPDTTDLAIDAKGLLSPRTSPPLFAATISEMIYALVSVFAEWEDADFDLPSFDAFAIAIPYAAGLVIDSPDGITSIIDTLLAGIPALYSITIAGKLYVQELEAPTGPHALSITDEQIMDLPEFKQLPDITKRVYLEYDKNYTTNTSKDLAGVSQARLAWLKRGSRSISRKDDTVLVNYPMASDIGPLETALNVRADAGALADKLLALYQAPHETMDVQISLQAIPLDIGDVVMVTRDTFGQSGGQLYMVQGISINFTDGQSTVTLWR